MRHPAFRVLLAALLAVALLAGVTVTAGSSPPAVDGDASALTGGDAPSLDAGHASSLTGNDGLAVTGATAQRRAMQFEPGPETEIRIDLQSDRDAEWAVLVRYELTDENETATFETVGDRFEAGEVGPSADPFRNFAAGANRNTDREMAIEGVTRNATLYEDPERLAELGVGTPTEEGDDADATAEDADVVAVGEFRLSFTWTAFLEEDGENLRLGDALTTPENGTWLRSLESGQSIEVAPPDGYTVSGTPGASVTLRDNAVVIEGPRVFVDGEPVAVVYSPTPGQPEPDGPPWGLLAGAIVAAALVVAVGLVAYRRLGGEPEDVTGAGGAADAPGSPGAPAADTGDDAAAGESDGEPEEDLSLLSDEERVERLLERNGGRMRQADIVSETGWSDAKVSQLLSAMADEGRVEKLRLGRENLISLPDRDAGGDAGSDDGDDPGGAGGGV